MIDGSNTATVPQTLSYDSANTPVSTYRVMKDFITLK